MTRLKRRLDIDYDEEHDVAYIYLVPRNGQAGLTEELGDVNHTKKLVLTDEGGTLLVDRDPLNRILGLEIIGAMGMLPPHFLLDEDDPAIDWQSPPKNLMNHVRSMTEKAAILAFVARAKARSEETHTSLDDSIRTELTLL